MISSLLIPSLVLLVGLALLVWSSDIFIDGAASTAVHLQISPLIIGVVVLGFGTSMPEIVVSSIASLDNSPGLAIGNAIGSNIANVGLVLGVTALIAPIIVKSSILKRELPMLLAISLGVFLLLSDGSLDFFDGIIMVSALVAAMFWMIRVNKEIDPSDPIASETQHEIESMQSLSMNKSLLFLLIGLIILMSSAQMMVWGAEHIARYFEVPDVIIGLTIIAIGTSLPELAAAIAAARKNEADLMIGNIVGSNLFNILAVLSVPALIAPGSLEKDVLWIDYPVMLGFTLLMLVLALPLRGKTEIAKVKGLLLTSLFVAYLGLLYVRSTGA
ncbi:MULTISPECIES: calcium/sodium antiporter [Thiomicrorhabdus]|uniref:Calcium/sodium antiporter n=1 Tax=Thiomicrorhabdus heinhorstiae TaxID=2748010 RepID=A0ABS0BTU4_9GAMM|nr:MULTISPECIES: calcium/sodium antiporter [Thiomicrorhabdus]MBF6057229.1 calcium/sodium antiporter [Thiomicrorhabdus heinhorstiae]